MSLPPGVEAVLEVLDLPPRPPDGRYLDDLLRRLAFAVPLYGVPDARREPEEVLSAFAEGETGTAGGERAAAVAFLASALGFEVSRAQATGGAPGPREVLLVNVDGRWHLADPTFPLPLALPLDGSAGERPTGFGRVSLRPAPGGAELWLDTRGEERRIYAVSPAEGVPVDRDASPRAPVRLLDDRFVRLRNGVLEIADAWSRLLFTPPPSDRDGLAAFLPWPLPAGDGTAPSRFDTAPELRVYDASPLPEAELRRRLADPERGRIARPGEDGRGRRVRLQPRGAGTRVTLTLDLSSPSFPPRGLTESARKTLVFALAQELFSLSAD